MKNIKNKNKLIDKMKNQTKIIFAALLIIIGFIINSRRVKKEDFDLLVMLELTDVYKNCNSRIENNITEHNLDYNDSLYNTYIDDYGIEICLCKKDSLKSIIEKNIKENYKRNWLFVY